MRRITLLALIAAAAACALPAGTGAAARVSTCALDREYLQESISGSLFEIAGGRIAQRNSATPEIRQLAARLIADHSKSLDRAARLSRSLGLAVPGNPNPMQHWQLHVVSGLSGAAFDHSYAWLEVADHVVDIEHARTESRNGCHPGVRTLAKNALPTLQLHLRLATLAQKTT